MTSPSAFPRRAPLQAAWIAVTLLGTAHSLVHAQTVNVSSQCNIYASGHASPVGTCDTTIGPGILPVLVPIPAGATYAEFHDVTGSVQYCFSCTPQNGPDGLAGLPVANPPLLGIAGLNLPQGRCFEGVFLSPAEPSNPPPPTLIINDLSFTALSPLVAQHFFIGDGLTGTGTGSVQRFNIPPGATRLFLGFSDGFTGCVGAYNDNSGSVSATVVFDVSPCDPDVNQDGVSDQGDVDYLVNVIAGGSNPTSIDPDFNVDGVADQGDIDALINVIAGGSCP